MTTQEMLELLHKADAAWNAAARAREQTREAALSSNKQAWQENLRLYKAKHAEYVSLMEQIDMVWEQV
jgi:hypothetical protein